MEKKQTAIQWIIEQLQAPCRGIPSHIIEEALQMEREQIIDARQDGYDSTYNTCQYDCSGREELDGSHEQYYTQTYER